MNSKAYQLISSTALVVGASGYVGRNLCKALSVHYRVLGTYFSHPRAFEGEKVQVDIRDPGIVRRLFEQSGPDVVFHLAYDLEDLEGSVVQGTRNLLAAREMVCPGSRFIYVSTDAVFDGESGPYAEEDVPRPIWEYGRAKREAELKVLDAAGTVVRNSLVYGFDPLDPRTEELRRGLESGHFEYPYFEDEIRCPIRVEDLCDALVELGEMGENGPRILHIAGPEAVTRYNFAVRLARRMGYDPEGIPKVSLRETGTVRPRDLTLDGSLAEKLLTWSSRNQRICLF